MTMYIHSLIEDDKHVSIEKLVNVEIKISIIQQTLGQWCKTDVLSGWRVALSLGSCFECQALILASYYLRKGTGVWCERVSRSFFVDPHIL